MHYLSQHVLIHRGCVLRAREIVFGNRGQLLHFEALRTLLGCIESLRKALGLALAHGPGFVSADDIFTRQTLRVQGRDRGMSFDLPVK